MLKLVSTAAVMALTIVSTSHAASFNAAPVSIEPVVETVASRLTGAQRLRRLMRPHFKDGHPITQSVRDATGNPNIIVLDQRFGDPHQTYQCSFYSLRKGTRVLKCD
ncbi:MAG: hypothetical protein GKR97_07835 [Rhizobiaceae bacterium]|nr:hypothetical protein [Rhizobiaceae bacterium]